MLEPSPQIGCDNFHDNNFSDIQRQDEDAKKFFESGCIIVRSGSKKDHFRQVKRNTGIQYDQMVFFDDQWVNKDVEDKGVTFNKVGSAGLDWRRFKKGLRDWSDANNSSSSSSSDDEQGTNTNYNNYNPGGGPGYYNGGGYVPPPPPPPPQRTNNICGNPQCGVTFICDADYNRRVQPLGYPGVHR